MTVFSDGVALSEGVKAAAEAITKGQDHFSRYDANGDFRFNGADLSSEQIAELLSPELVNGLRYLQQKYEAFEITYSIPEHIREMPTVAVTTNGRIHPTGYCTQLIFMIKGSHDGEITFRHASGAKSQPLTLQQALELAVEGIYGAGLTPLPALAKVPEAKSRMPSLTS